MKAVLTLDPKAEAANDDHLISWSELEKADSFLICSSQHLPRGTNE